jgi:proline iminopeptidase
MSLYEHTPVLREGFLQVSPIHRIFYQVFGQESGPPCVFLHGGPAAGCNPTRAHRFFDPNFYKIVVFDQRGSGRSEPNAGVDLEAAIQDNNTWSIVEDIEKLRVFLNVEVWHLVFGGSWGSTLALAYSQAYPAMVKSLVLRGIFLFLQEDMDWLFQIGGVSEIYPDKFEEYVTIIPEEERHDMIAAYYKLLTSPDEATRFDAARRFAGWELQVSKVFVDQTRISEVLGEPRSFAPFALFECLFFKEKGFLRSNTQLLDEAHKIAHIPTIIIHGRQDVVCRPSAAWKLHKLLPKSQIEYIPSAGHSDSEIGIEEALVRATNAMRTIV